MKGSRMFACACTGGTYGPIHDGHKGLFDYAFLDSDNVVVRLTTDKYLTGISKKNLRDLIPPYDERFGKLYEYLNHSYRGRFEILPLDSRENCANCKFKNFTEAMVVGQDSLARAYKLNLIRRESGLYEVHIIGVPAKLSDNKERISSTDIRKKVITPEGRLIIL